MRSPFPRLLMSAGLLLLGACQAEPAEPDQAPPLSMSDVQETRSVLEGLRGGETAFDEIAFGEVAVAEDEARAALEPFFAEPLLTSRADRASELSRSGAEFSGRVFRTPLLTAPIERNETEVELRVCVDATQLESIPERDAFLQPLDLDMVTMTRTGQTWRMSESRPEFGSGDRVWQQQCLWPREAQP